MKVLLTLVLVSCSVGVVHGEVQSFDGTGNNLEHDDWGSVDHFLNFHFVRQDGYGYGPDDAPNARTISSQVFGSLPERYAFHGGNDLLPYFGQFICHDIADVPDDPSEPFNVPVAMCDDYFDGNCFGNKTIPFSRSKATMIGNGTIRVSINKASTWVDASTVYGVSKERNDKLRLFQDGLLRTSQGPNGDLLPLNTFGFVMAPGTNSSHFFAAGDHRANVNLPMVTLHTLFHLEHNFYARKLKAEHPDWNDQQLFDRARKYVIALTQKELYYHYVPLIIGKRLPEYNGYNSSIDPSIDTTFMTSAFRYGHSTTSKYVYLATEDRHPVATGHLPIGRTIFNPSEVKQNGLDNIIRGLMLQPEADADLSAPYDVRNHAILADLIAKDIQRGRDRGLASFNDVREQIGFPRYTSWEELTPDQDVQMLLNQTYPNGIDDLDAYIGGLAERPIERGVVPPTFSKLIELQFDRLRAADRFHYENNPDEEISRDVEARTLSAMVLDHTGIQSIAPDLFRVQSVTSNEECLDMLDDPALSSSGYQIVKPVQGMQFRWTLDPNSKSLNVFLSGVVHQSKGWIGIGFDSSKMLDTDIVVGYLDNGDCNVQPMHISANGDLLPRNNEADLSLGGTGYENSVLWINFTVSLPNLVGDEMDFIFAFGDEFNTYHGREKRTVLRINLVTADSTTGGAYSDAAVLYYMHGLIMGTAWLVLIPLSAMVVHFFPTSTLAMELHQAFAQAGSLGIVAFAGMAVALHPERVYTTFHGFIGFMIVVFMVFQIGLGWGLRAGLAYIESVTKLKALKRFHRHLGYILLAMAFINGWIGLDLLFEGQAQLPFLLYFNAVIGVVIGLTIQKTGLLGNKGSISGISSTSGGSTGANLQSTLSALPKWTMETFVEKVGQSNQFIKIGDYVIDIRSYAMSHPGGRKLMENYIGMDCTEMFQRNKNLHSNSKTAVHLHSVQASLLKDTLACAQIKKPSTRIQCYEHMKLKQRRNVNEGSDIAWMVEFKFDVSGSEELFKCFQYGDVIRIMFLVDHQPVSRPYTIVDYDREKKEISLLVKIYRSGVVTSRLDQVKVGQTVKMQGFMHECGSVFNTNDSNTVIVTGGSGLTPGLAYVNYHEANPNLKIWMIVVNRDEMEEFYVDELTKLVDTKRVQKIIHHHTRLDGRLSMNVFKQLDNLPTDLENAQMTFILSGPSRFVSNAASIINKLGYKHTNIEKFL